VINRKSSDPRKQQEKRQNQPNESHLFSLSPMCSAARNGPDIGLSHSNVATPQSLLELTKCEEKPEAQQ
jgi:hypothetical protein